MNCRRLGKLLSLYLDGRLPDSRARETEEHLRSCGDCRRAWEDLRRTSQLLNSLPPGKLSFDLAPEIVARSQDRRGGEWRRLRRYWFAPRQHFLLRQLGKALAVAVLLLALSGPSGKAGSAVWPARLGGATETALAYVKMGMAKSEGLLARYRWGTPPAPGPISDKRDLDDLRGKPGPEAEGPRPAPRR
jgi:hypothetical protein